MRIQIHVVFSCFYIVWSSFNQMVRSTLLDLCLPWASLASWALQRKILVEPTFWSIFWYAVIVFDHHFEKRLFESLEQVYGRFWSYRGFRSCRIAGGIFWNGELTRDRPWHHRSVISNFQIIWCWWSHWSRLESQFLDQLQRPGSFRSGSTLIFKRF